MGCSFGGIHKEIQRDFFQKLGVPSIALEGSFQVGPPTGQLLTRVRAFIEMFDGCGSGQATRKPSSHGSSAEAGPGSAPAAVGLENGA